MKKGAFYIWLLFQFDRDIFDHSVKVTRICRRLANYLDLEERTSQILVMAGLFHDIGKLEVDLSILSKERELTKKEFEEVRNHPRMGWIMTRDFLGNETASLILTHHEPGYPRKETREGERNRDLRNLLQLADRYDALRSPRSYKRGLSAEETKEILTKEGFDPELINAIEEAHFY